MFETEEKLAIQIAQVNGIEVDDMDFAKAGKEEVLEQLAADATSAHEQHSRLQTRDRSVSNGVAWNRSQ